MKVVYVGCLFGAQFSPLRSIDANNRRVVVVGKSMDTCVITWPAVAKPSNLLSASVVYCVRRAAESGHGPDSPIFAIWGDNIFMYSFEETNGYLAIGIVAQSHSLLDGNWPVVNHLNTGFRADLHVILITRLSDL